MHDGRGYACVGLYRPKNTLNVGSALRASAAYRAAFVAVSGMRAAKHLSRIPTDTPKAWRHMPLIRCDDLHSVLPYDCIPVAVEIVAGAKSLPSFTHPARAFYLFGPEDGSLDDDTLEWCKVIVSVPTACCMNLAATVNVVLYDRMVKRSREETT